MPAHTTPKGQVTENSARIEVARLFLILLVCYFHYNFSPDSNAVFLKIDSFFRTTFLLLSVPLLSMISGYLFFATEAYKNGPETLWKKVKALVFPFLIFNTPLVLLIYFVQIKGGALDNRLLLAGADYRTWLDAVFALTARPVNYPLHFLRDIFVISVLAIPVSRLFIRFQLPCLLVIFLVSCFNLEGAFILRNDALWCFFIGGAFAVSRIDINSLDRYALPITFLVIPALCLVFYFFLKDQALAFRSLGAILVWPGIGLLAATRLGARAARLSLFAFPLFLLHAPALKVLEGIGWIPTASVSGIALWMSAPLIILGLCAVCTTALRRVSPMAAAILFGGRII